MLFRDATGTFYNDRWKPLFEGLTNVVLSIAFVYLFSYAFGESFAVVGVITATIITNILICHIVEPHVLYKYALHISAGKYYLKNYLYIALFAAVLIALNFCLVDIDNVWIELAANACISIAVSLAVIVAAIVCDRDFRHYVCAFIKKIKSKLAY